MAIRHSPRLHHKQCTQEAGKKVQKGTPPACTTLSRRSFVLSRLWSMGSVAGRAEANHLPTEQGGPSRKGMSSTTTFVPPATSGRESTGQMPESPPEYPDYDSVMALYNTCYSILTAALSSTAPNEAPGSEEEQGEYMCVLCEHVKDKPNL